MSGIREILLYGAGNNGRYVLASLPPDTSVVAVCDGDARKHGTFFCGHRVLLPEAIPGLTFDVVVVATVRFDEVRANLLALGIAPERIVSGLAPSVLVGGGGRTAAETRRKAVLYGAGQGGKYAVSCLPATTEVIAVADSDGRKHGTCFCGHRVVPPERITQLEFDVVLVATVRFDEVCARLLSLGIPMDRIERGITAPVSGAHEGSPPEAWDYCPLVSVVMPVYNREAVVGRAVRSVLGQSYANWELLVIDDGSTDGTARVLEALGAGEPRIRLLRGPHHGVSAARNAGLAAAGGELVAYLDSDNRWHSDYLRYMVVRFAGRKYECGYTGMNMIDEGKGEFRPWIPGYDRAQLEQMNFIDLNVFMHRRRLAAALGGFDTALTRLVDWDLVLRYTRDHVPFVLRAVLADYFVSAGGGRVTENESFNDNYERLSARHNLNCESKERS